MNDEFWPLLLLLGLLAWTGAFYFWQRLAIRPRPWPPEPSSYPSVSVIRPVKGKDTGVAENLAAAFQHGYPGKIETLFVLDDENEPSVPLIERAIAEARRQEPDVDARILYSGQPPPHRTGKLNAMIAGLESSRNELVAFIDSDIRQDRDDLKVLVATLLADETAGAAFATVISKALPRTLGDVGYALMVNGLYEPSALATAHRLSGQLPFIMGHIMVLQRDAIRAIGGLESAEGQLVDDMYLGRRLHQLGYRNKISPKPAAMIQQGMAISECIQILVRWVAFSMSGLPWLTCKLPHFLTGLAFWTGILIGVTAGLRGDVPLACLASLLPLSAAATINDLHYRMSGARMPLKYWWGALALWLSAPVIYAQIWIRREVNWRGRHYRLDKYSRLLRGDSEQGTHPPAARAESQQTTKQL